MLTQCCTNYFKNWFCASGGEWEKSPHGFEKSQIFGVGSYFKIFDYSELKPKIQRILVTIPKNFRLRRAKIERTLKLVTIPSV